MTKQLITFLALLIFQAVYNQENTTYLNNQTPTFEETIAIYKKLAQNYPNRCHYEEIGSSDYGIPMPLFILNSTGIFTQAEYDSKNVLLINNGIHPGEPCGIDACIKLATELAKGAKMPENSIIAIIPIYNIGGAHNRNCCSRANQNGPLEYGFRGNAKNLDLNRDFIKADSKNVRAFYAIFHLLKPAIFVDTHTSNGADYQHTMTLITSQLNKMNPALATYVKSTLNPYLYQRMEADHYPMIPYVHSIEEIPDSGIVDYLETPRYSTGYTNLFNTISYVTEAHMLKSYPDRVETTYFFLNHVITFMENHAEDLKNVRKSAANELKAAKELAINWVLDTAQYELIPFRGYEARYKTSLVTGIDRLYYDRESPYTKPIRYYNQYQQKDLVKVPQYYIIPQAWEPVVNLLKANNVGVFQLKSDQHLWVETYEILHYQTTKSPYEGHYLHYNTEVESHTKEMPFRKGDYVIPVDNENKRFIVETLEPHAADSYFSWNYFDAILQQKEWFSAYVFEDEAAEILANNPDIKREFEAKKASDTVFATSAFEQLYFIYKKSPNYEKTTNQYPVVRLMNPLEKDQLSPTN